MERLQILQDQFQLKIYFILSQSPIPPSSTFFYLMWLKSHLKLWTLYYSSCFLFFFNALLFFLRSITPLGTSLVSVAAFSSSSIFWTCPVLVLYVRTSALWFRLDVPPFPYYIVECWWSYVLVFFFFFSVFQVKKFWANSNAITFYFRRGQTLSNCVYIWFVYAETRLSLFFIWNWRRKQHPSQSLLRKEGKKKKYKNLQT